MATNDILLVAAIDFGTTFSGWAYAFKNEYESDPSRIHAKNWNNGSNISTKTPTTVLIQPDGETFEAFGYEAEDKYAALTAEGKQRNYYFFNRFKMMLHDRLNFGKDILLEDAYGKSLPAKDVFKHAIRFLRNDLKQECSKGIIGTIEDSEIIWVLTVPAIWNEMAKHFMREAAEEAGIPSSALKIALEPEAASLFCRTMALEKKANFDSKFCNFETGAKYIVLDAGGGTVDVAIHEVLDNDSLRELYKASGGAWGGTTVDEAFKQMLIEIFGQAVLTKFRNDNMDDYIDLFRSFEVKKRSISKTTENDTIVSLPATLMETYTEETYLNLKMAVQSSKLSKFLKAEKGNKLRIEHSFMKQLFSTAVENTAQHISKLLGIKGVTEVNTLIMVGGLSESNYVQESIKQLFPYLNVVVPSDASLTVLKGAVLFGYKPTAVSERKVRFTYGLDISVPFENGVHPRTKLRYLNQKQFCTGVFGKIVEADRSVKRNERIRDTEVYSPLAYDCCRVSLYGSSEIWPNYVTDQSCFLVGTFIMYFEEKIPENLEKKFTAACIFGETEVKLEMEEVETGKIYSSLFKLTES